MSKNEDPQGEPDARCNMFGGIYPDDELELFPAGEHDWFKGCPECKTDGYLMDVETTTTH